MEILFRFIIAVTLLKISIIDYKTYQIPVKYNLFLAGLGIIKLIYRKENPVGYVLGAVFFLVFLGVFYKQSQGRMIGGGDVKLMTAAGLLLGLQKSLTAFISACFLAFFVEGFQRVIKGKRDYFAMGPYLSAGIFLMLFIK